MALDTSSDAYEKVYDSSGLENQGKYYEGYVEKKEKFKWIRYWCVLKHQNIHFFKDVNTQIKENYVGYLHLEQPTNVDIIKSKDGKYDWCIKTKRGKITLRTNVHSLRDGWITSMEKSLKHEPPSTESYILQGSGPVSPKHKGSSSPKHSPSRKASLQNYIVCPEQVATWREFSHEVEAMVELTDQELGIHNALLSDDKGWYQASLRREDVEKILSNENNGVFIVRDYIDNRTGKNMGYVISLKDETSFPRHHRIQEVQGGFVLKGYEGRCFDSLYNLLRFFILSQRKKITLVPFDPKKRNQLNSGYENMDPRRPNAMSPTTPVKPRSRSFQDRSLPTPPPLEDAQGPCRNGYEEMMSPSRSFKSRPLPCPPPLDDRQFTPSSVSQRPLPVPPPDDRSYTNMQPPVRMNSRYENVPASKYENIGVGLNQDEPVPALPPKKRVMSLKEERPYVNYPRSDMPERTTRQKSHTLTL